MRSLRKTTESFILEAKQIFENFYDYSLVDYKGCLKPITIICPLHGEFLQKPSNHLFGQGCNLCGKIKSLKGRTSTKEKFIEKANKKHKNFFNYDKVNYINALTFVTVTCPIHGDFTLNPNSHLNGTGCKLCYKDRNGFGKKSFISACKNNIAYLYIIRCFSENENFYKIGITSKSVTERFKNCVKFPYEYEVCRLYKDKPFKIFNMEKRLHKKYKNFKYKPLKHFKGETECFILNKNIILNEF